MFCFIVCLFVFFKVGANKKTPLCDTSIICSNKARTGLHSDLFSVFGLQSSTHIQPLTSFHPVGIDGREGFEQAHAEYHDSPLQTRSHDEHVLCGPQRVRLAEKGHPALRPTFVASCTKSQTQEFCALFSSSPAFVPSTWAIVWLSFEVSVSPWSSFSAIYVSQWTFLLRFEEAEWFVQWSAHSQLCICSSIHGCHQEKTWWIPKSLTLTEEKNQCCVLALRKNKCSKK